MSNQDLALNCLIEDGKYTKSIAKGTYLWLEGNVSGEKVEAVVTNCSPTLLTFVIIESGDVYTMTPDLFVDTFFVAGFKFKVPEKDYGSYVKNVAEKAVENVVSTVNEIKDQLTSPECKAKAKEAGEKAKEVGAKAMTTTTNVLNSVFSKLNEAVQNVKSTISDDSEAENAETEEEVTSTDADSTDNNVVANVEEAKGDVVSTLTVKNTTKDVGETEDTTALDEEGRSLIVQFRQLGLDTALIEEVVNTLTKACNNANRDNTDEALEKLIDILEEAKEKLEARK